MNTKISHLKTLRVYKHLSYLQLFSHLICNRVMKSHLFVASAPSIYNFCRFFPGHTITNLVISNIFNKFFTGGNSLSQLQKTSEHLTKLNIPLMIDYCAEEVIENPQAEQRLDENARLFRESAIWSAKYHRFLFSIKISGLVDMNLLQKYNKSVQLRDKIWIQSCENGIFSSQKLYQNFKKICQGVTEEHYQTYLKQIHNYNGSSREFKIDQIEFKINHHPYYFYQTHKNDFLLTKITFPLDQHEQNRMSAFLRRLNQILEVQFRNPNDLRVLVEAQQSYIQNAIQSITEQLQQKYNKEKVYIIPTLQNYLKIAKQRLDFELEMVKRRKIKFAIQLVRGAYLVQQTKLSKQKNYQSPIVSGFDSTTGNYLSNFDKIIKSGLQGEIFCAGHNQLTIETLLDLKRKTETKIKINFAQLFGLSDHLTLLLKRERENVYKLLPWAETQVLVPYMIRRAQLLSQTQRYPLNIQNALLRHELLYRIFPF